MFGLYGSDPVTFFARKKDREEYYIVADHFSPEEAAAAAAVLLRIEGGRRLMISDDPDLAVPAGVEFRNIVDWMLEDSTSLTDEKR